jgi:hypothetical protein
VREDDQIHFLRRTSEAFVLWPSLIRATLKQATVEEDSGGRCFDQMLTASNFARSTKKYNLHSG